MELPCKFGHNRLPVSELWADEQTDRHSCLEPVRRVDLNVSDGDDVTVGEVIQCSADSIHPSVSYYWQQYVNESWHQLQQLNDGPVLRLSTAGVYVLRCVAYNVIRNHTYHATSNRITLYVREPGKCFLRFEMRKEPNSSSDGEGSFRLYWRA